MNNRLLLTVHFSVFAALLLCTDPQKPDAPPDNPPVDTLVPFSPSGDIRFNEICVANGGIIQDEDFDDPDWIELYNQGDSTVNLEGYALSDDSTDPTPWRFGNIELAPKSYLLVFASGKDRAAVTEKPADDSINIKAFSAWSDSMGSGGRSTVYPYGTKSVLSNDSTGRWQICATFNQVDNRPELNWSSVNASIMFKRKQTALKYDYSMYDAMDLVLTLEKDKKLTLRFILRSLPEWKGPQRTLTGTGIVNDLYRIALIQGEGGLDLTELTGIRIESKEYDYGTVSFILRRLTFSANNGNLHTNFKLSGEESCFLIDPAGTLRDKAALSPLPVDMTVGSSGDQGWRILARATPGAENVPETFTALTRTPQAACSGGFFKDPVQVTLFTADSAPIYYTLDGSLPAAAGEKYVDPVSISATGVLRYRAIAQGAAGSAVQTQSYFINETVRLPVVSLSTDSALLFDPDTGLYMKGSGAGDSFPYFGANFWEEKEVPVHCELYEVNGARTFSADAGLSIAGNWSRGMDKKSLQINFREAYGSPELECPLFPAYPHLKRFKKFILRNNGGSYNGSLINNAMMQSLIDTRGVDYQKSRAVVVYINGRYFGIHFLMEPANHDYVYTNYGLEKEEIDMYDRGNTLKWGTPGHWVRLLDMLESSAGSDCSREMSDSVYALVQQEMDVYNFIDYNAFEIYIGNTDWPANNNRRWRNHNGNGRWRWLVYDLDAGFGGFGLVDGGELVGHNTLAFALDGSQQEDFWPNGGQFTFPLRALMQNRTFREDFINRFATLLATNFKPDRVLRRIDDLAGEIRDEVPVDHKRWNYDVKNWEEGVVRLKAYGSERASYMYGFIKEQFNLDSTFTLTIDAEPGSVYINGMEVKERPFTGTYFTAVPLRLTAYPALGKTLRDWGDGNSDNPRRLSGSAEVTLKPVVE